MKAPNNTFTEFDINKFLENDVNKISTFSGIKYIPNENDTYIQSDIRQVLNRKLAQKYIRTIGLPDNNASINALRYMIIRNSDVSNYYVFTTRNIIQPSKWYTRLSEQLPERIKFYPKYTLEDLKSKETQGHILLRKYLHENGIAKVSEQYNISIANIKNLIYQKTDKATGKMRFKCLPSFQVINMFRHIINPDYWFIFPEELEENQQNVQVNVDDKIKELLEYSYIKEKQLKKELSKEEIEKELKKYFENTQNNDIINVAIKDIDHIVKNFLRNV